MQPDARSEARPGGYDTRHERTELLLLGAALTTILAVVLVSISAMLG